MSKPPIAVFRRAAAAGGPRRRTIRQLIVNETARMGRAPTAEEIAGLLAMSVARVRWHLAQLRNETSR